jgi:hypothetical protein
MGAASCCTGGQRRRDAASPRALGPGLRVVTTVATGHRPSSDSSAIANSSRTGPTRSVTLVTQCSDDRLPQLARTAAGWGGGCIAVAVLLSRNAGVRAARAQVRTLVDAAYKVNGCWMKVLLVMDARPPPAGGVLTAPGALYPINALRNLALAAACTELILVADVDQCPSRGLADALADAGRYLAIADALLSSRTALVVPAFEPTATAVGDGVPDQVTLTAGQLRSWVDAGVAITFGSDVYPRGHGGTDEAGWFRMACGDAPTPLAPRDWPRCEYTDGYEPYVIVSRVGVPPFDERYEGYGRNKIAWIRNLAALGFAFHACPCGYLLHQPHPPSAAQGEFRARRMAAIIALDDAAAAEVRVDPRAAVWRHAPGFAAADLRRNGRSRDHGETTIEGAVLSVCTAIFCSYSDSLYTRMG